MRSLRVAVVSFLVFLNLLLVKPPAFAAEVADSVYCNGIFYTVSEQTPKAEAVAIKDGKFIFVGSNEEVKAYIGSDTKVVDLKGKTVLPGLIESHMHYASYGALQMQIQAHWRPKEEILEAVKKAYPSAKEKGEWILGRGWNQEVWDPPQFPTRAELDAIAPDVPVYLVRTCGHAAWVNSKALEIAGITAETPDPEGGEIYRDEKGQPTGILTDTAMKLVSGKIPPLTEDQQRRALLAAQENLLSYGITTANDMGTSLETFNLMKELYEDGKLKIRIYAYGASGSYGKADATSYAPFLEMGPQKELYNDRLTLGGLKFYADGSLGARSAWLKEEYSDRPGHFGNPRETDESLYAMVIAARKAGFQAATHAIGDAANHQVLNVYEKVLKEIPEPKDHRFRIEHAQVISLEDIPRFAALGILPSMQTCHATSDKNMAESRVGPERIKGAYAWRKLINAGSIIPNGTDAPVELVNPYQNLFAAVTRMDTEGQPPGGWYPEEKMTREEALKSYTIWGAYADFKETTSGSIEKGKWADFVVIDKDYMSCPEMEIKDINALLTVVAGEVLYSR